MNLWSVLVQLCILAERLLGNFNNQGGEDSPVQQLEPQTISTPLTPPPAIVQAPLLLVSTLLELDIESQFKRLCNYIPKWLALGTATSIPHPRSNALSSTPLPTPVSGLHGAPGKRRTQSVLSQYFSGINKTSQTNTNTTQVTQQQKSITKKDT